MVNEKPGAQRAPLPKRKYIRLPLAAYADRFSIFNVTIDALDRRAYFDQREFNHEVVATLRGFALMHRCPIKIYCLMPTHLHMLINPGSRSLIDFIGELKKKTSDLARETRGIPQLWQRSFFDHRLRTWESEAEQYDYIRANPVRQVWWQTRMTGRGREAWRCRGGLRPPARQNK